MIEVVAALVQDENRFLICRRPEGKQCARCWEFAGGKVEPGETGAQALAREWREELGVELRVGDVLADVTHAYPDLTVHLTLYAAEITSGAPLALEHSQLRWISPQELENYVFCPADARLLEQLKGRL